ncbi:Bgt-1831 [Blumeria graminis f. sp. tritici]|uniref:Bgt-1831 n=2 Tax=Blumeria graminis f. sp. tritici TaxID=62690 RepID=A0A061HBU6_BLUGR|nr:hypothetical protein BGT96224_1831 [Blumeria graminis f. sp. tritici 96224]VCU39103.1 Bgt-1831 [Blumeria graminis f. sp. tritici]
MSGKFGTCEKLAWQYTLQICPCFGLSHGSYLDYNHSLVGLLALRKLFSIKPP